ncbi:MAG: cyclic nucleotide-binding domain-containing protein [Chloroflexota bacterium]|nr:cyclic nucleotide-binding domain-containing protein [Chloroflexota bacterium]
MSIDFLRKQLLFAGLSEDDLIWLEMLSEPVSISSGEYLMREGGTSDGLYIASEGEFEVVKRSGNQDVPIARRGPGEIFGEMSLLNGTPHSASVRSLKDAHLYKISGAVFRDLLSTRPQATLAILRTVTERLRNTEAMLHQSEKMAALGTLSAGLAHELNNPAAAAKRSASQLRDTLVEWQRAAAELAVLTLDARQKETLNALRGEMATRAAVPVTLDPLTRSDHENALQEWLEARGMEEAWQIAPPLVTFGWDVKRAEELGGVFGAELPVIMRWLGVGYLVYALLDEVSQSAERISEIVKAVKSYSYLDQAPIQQVDVHEGLENTLVILRHKLKEGVRVTREYAPNLPRIEVYGSELNQVWTNLIDNAIDAMGGKGELRLRTYQRDECVVVEITDNGPGIPPEIQPRLFEPFFTTKPPGVGTGLGLHISYNIIQKHQGQIKIDSRPGATTFQVSLPIQIKK